MTKDGSEQHAKPGLEHQRLDAFVGTWNTEGQVRASSSGPAVRIAAIDTYQWLEGGFFLLHRWDAQMPDGNTKGIEVIGYDAASKTYPMHSFDNLGNVAVMHASVDGNRWTFTGESVRYTGGFSDDGKTFAGLWERRSDDGASWSPWMDVTLRKARVQG